MRYLLGKALQVKVLLASTLTSHCGGYCDRAGVPLQYALVNILLNTRPLIQEKEAEVSGESMEIMQGGGIVMTPEKFMHCLSEFSSIMGYTKAEGDGDGDGDGTGEAAHNAPIVMRENMPGPIGVHWAAMAAALLHDSVAGNAVAYSIDIGVPEQPLVAKIEREK